MAGIKVPRYEIFKIGTDRLKYNNWDITISKKTAFKYNELVELFEGHDFRQIAYILGKSAKKIDFSQYIIDIVIDSKADFARCTSDKGIIVNGNTFKRFVGTNGGLKNNSLLFVNVDILDELNRLCDCGRDKSVKIVPSKYESYKALTCSASQPIINPRKILVVSDSITKFKDSVINLDDSDDTLPSPKISVDDSADIENTVTDGFTLCTIDFMQKVAESLGLNYVPSGVCLRNAWFKGMLYPFPIYEFIEEYNGGNYIVKDIWGNEQDIRECDMITTESSLKLWKCYASIDDYMAACKKNNYSFSVTKISPHVLEDKRRLNYQYLQSYELSDEDIYKLCKPTVDFLKDSLCRNYEETMKFLGGMGDSMEEGWQKALATNSYMMNDPYIIDCVHRLIKKKINEAKIGKLLVDGNYQIGSGDPFILMQHVCGLKETGLLKANECYSYYWDSRNTDEIVIFRSPMTSHNNIRKCKVARNDECRKWYKYMDTIMIINGWDTFCMAENGCDWDSDIFMSTNDEVLVQNHISLPAINCIQRNIDKIVITEAEILKTNKNGMGNAVGKVTNRVTTMLEVRANFPKDSKEYEELTYRIDCGQLYQQNEIDKIKGVVAKPMPNNWYSRKACGDDKFLQSICADKKPYFMMYVYNDYRKKYNSYIEKSNAKCYALFSRTIAELEAADRTPEQDNFLYWYHEKMPLGMGKCAMNRICWYIEDEFKDYTIHLKANSIFDYNKLKTTRRCTTKHRDDLLELSKLYVDRIKEYKSSRDEMQKEDRMIARQYLKNSFRKKAAELCPNDDERLNIFIDLCYEYKANKQFFWDCVGDLMINRLEELKDCLS